MSFTECEAEQRHIFGWIMRIFWYKIIEQKDEKRKNSDSLILGKTSDN